MTPHLSAVRKNAARNRPIANQGKFLRAFARDLRRMGFAASVRPLRRRLQLLPKYPRPSEQDLVLYARRIRARQFLDEQDFRQACEHQYQATLLRRDPVTLEAVTPRLHVCTDAEAFRLFDYCRSLQGVPSSKLVARRMSVLVFDAGAAPARLIGAFGLNSSPYSLRARDDLLGWATNTPTATRVKHRGLRCLMDMPICAAVPPYSYVLGSKLLAALALSEEANLEYVARYARRLPRGGSLAGVVTLSATGIHSAVFNRITLVPGGLYRRIGLTAGFSTMFISQDTLTLAKQVAQDAGVTVKEPLFAKSMRIVKRALELCGIHGEAYLRFGVKKGIYFGASDKSALVMLRTGQYQCFRRPSVAAITNYWQPLARRRQARSAS